MCVCVCVCVCVYVPVCVCMSMCMRMRVCMGVCLNVCVLHFHFSDLLLCNYVLLRLPGTLKIAIGCLADLAVGIYPFILQGNFLSVRILMHMHSTMLPYLAFHLLAGWGNHIHAIANFLATATAVCIF